MLFMNVRPEMSTTSYSSVFWEGRRVLLTGYTGFKGAWLALWLKQLGAVVHGLALPPDKDQLLFPSLNLDIPAHQIDLSDREAVRSCVEAVVPEVVLHLAAQPLVRRSYADPIGTWSTNLMGSLHLLDALRLINSPCAVVMVTTDKVYANQEWPWGYREDDRLGGHDPYSASKAGVELAIASWRKSFIGSLEHQTPNLAIATARAGNVIGGGDGSADRLFPDCISALQDGRPISIRNPLATRPWQHVLEPLAGYLLLAERLLNHQLTSPAKANPYATSYNFGPSTEANRPVYSLVDEVLQHWPGSWVDKSDASQPHESTLLHLVSDKAQQELGWRPRWSFSEAVGHTTNWYLRRHQGADARELCLEQLEVYLSC
ncbi:CDP-glucose 4,6-dehydratase [Synechococcus sp. AH-736-G20]|nr:CDP-glucose 4,6-dehydratase [Synechococcus sp. AH-736-G20]